MPRPSQGSIPSELGWLVDMLDDYERRLRVLEAPSGEALGNTVAKLQDALAKLQDTIAAIPITLATTVRTSGFGLAAGRNTYATATLVVPDGKTSAAILGIGAAMALDKTSGGLTSANARILIDGAASGGFPAAKDAGASVVANVMNAQHAHTLTGLVAGATITVAFQISPLNPAAFPGDAQNFASITALGSFT